MLNVSSSHSDLNATCAGQSQNVVLTGRVRRLGLLLRRLVFPIPVPQHLTADIERMRVIDLVVAKTGDEMPLNRAIIGGQLQDIAVEPVAQALFVRAADDEERRIGAARIGKA